MVEEVCSFCLWSTDKIIMTTRLMAALNFKETIDFDLNFSVIICINHLYFTVVGLIDG